MNKTDMFHLRRWVDEWCLSAARMGVARERMERAVGCRRTTPIDAAFHTAFGYRMLQIQTVLSAMERAL